MAAILGEAPGEAKAFRTGIDTAERTRHSAPMTPYLARRAMRIAALFALLLTAAGCGSGFMTEEPYLVSGDIKGAEVRVETARTLADNIAERHCAQYNRTARFIGKGPDTAYYECDER